MYSEWSYFNKLKNMQKETVFLGIYIYMIKIFLKAKK